MSRKLDSLNMISAVNHKDLTYTLVFTQTIIISDYKSEHESEGL